MRFSACLLRCCHFIAFSIRLACCSCCCLFFVACCTQSFNPNVLFATTLSYAHSSNHNRSNKQQRQRQQAQKKQQHSLARRCRLSAVFGLAPAQFHARVNYLSTILSATKVRVPVSEPSKQAPKRTQVPASAAVCPRPHSHSRSLSRCQLKSARPAKRKRARCHDTQGSDSAGKQGRAEPGRVGACLFWGPAQLPL